MSPKSRMFRPVRRDDDVGIEVVAGLQLDARLVERLDVIGDDARLTATQRAEEIAVGHGAQALIPRVVARREVGIHIEVSGELLHRGA